MRKTHWIKAGLLTALLAGAAMPAMARDDDNNGGGRDRHGGEARGRPDNGGGAPARPDNGGDRGQGWGRPNGGGDGNGGGPRTQRDFTPRPGTPEARGPEFRTAAPPPPPAPPAPVLQSRPQPGWQGSQNRPNGGPWQANADRDRHDGANRDRDNRDWRNRNGGGGNADRSDRDDNDRRPGDNRTGNARDWRDRDGDRDRNWRDRDRRDDNRNDRDRRYTPRPPVTNRWNDMRRWDNDWRRDRRYDWQDWRRYHRDVFRLPRYYAPYGWGRGYFRFSIGVYIDSILFGDSYWIDDPWTYRLPPAYGTLRWIRYYNDALLVDIRDGYVVDVIYDVFW